MRKILIVHRDKRDPLNAWLAHHPVLDLGGGGEDTFTNRLHVIGGNPNDVHYIASWKMPDAWFTILLGWISQLGWDINTSDPSWDFSWYDGDTVTAREARADVTRKPYALEFEDVE